MKLSNLEKVWFSDQKVAVIFKETNYTIFEGKLWEYDFSKNGDFEVSSIEDYFFEKELLIYVDNIDYSGDDYEEEK
jgi:hypothetical protein